MLRATLASAALIASAAAAPSAYATPSASVAPPEALAGRPLISDERGCTEIAYIRGGLRDVIRPLVPERYELVTFPPPSAPPPPPGSPARVQLLINEVVCDLVETQRGRTRSRQREVTTVIVSASIESIDGKPSDGGYMLLYATENKAQRKAMKRLGWRVDRLDRRSGGSLTTSPDGSTQAAIVLRGAGWDSELRASTLTPLPEPSTSTSIYYRDTRSGEVKLCFANRTSLVGALYTGNLSRSPLATLTSAPPIFNGYPGYLINGGWRSTLTTGSCPDADK